MDTHALESRAAMLADAASQVQPLAPRAVSRIRNEVVARRSRRRLFGVFGVQRLSVRARLAFAIGLVILCATTAGGARVLWRKYVASARTAAPPPAETVPRPISPAAFRRPARPDAPQAPAAVPDEPSVVAVTDAPSLPTPARSRVARPSPAAAIEPPARAPSEAALAPIAAPLPAAAPPHAPPATATEAALVAEALFDLRQRNDARGALATLDRHARAFPHGVLETEALRTRIEAVIQLGDLKAALALLDGKAASVDALGADLTLTRAELRAAAGRFREALPDFNQILDNPAGPLVAGGDERALYGRAICLGRLAQDARARVDLLAYQQRFPGGRFAVEVRRLLADSESTPRP